VRRRHASHITVVLSKAAHSGPSVCLRARAPCPLRVSCPGTDRAERAAQAAGVSVQCKLQVLALPCLPWVQDTILLVINNIPQKTYRIAQYTVAWYRLHSLLGCGCPRTRISGVDGKVHCGQTDGIG
jgi:hypothetical protein